MKQPRVSDDHLRQAARFLRGQDAGADVRVLELVAGFLDRQLKHRALTRERERNKGKAETELPK